MPNIAVQSTHIVSTSYGSPSGLFAIFHVTTTSLSYVAVSSCSRPLPPIIVSSVIMMGSMYGVLYHSMIPSRLAFVALRFQNTRLDFQRVTSKPDQDARPSVKAGCSGSAQYQVSSVVVFNLLKPDMAPGQSQSLISMWLLVPLVSANQRPQRHFCNIIQRLIFSHAAAYAPRWVC
jgi:hypothetical protein